jgi:hypothetical protein
MYAKDTLDCKVQKYVKIDDKLHCAYNESTKQNLKFVTEEVYFF